MIITAQGSAMYPPLVSFCPCSHPPWLWGLTFVVDSVNGSPAAGVPRRVPEVTTLSHTCLDIRRAHTEYTDRKLMVLPQETQATTRWSKTLQS